MSMESKSRDPMSESYTGATLKLTTIEPTNLGWTLTAIPQARIVKQTRQSKSENYALFNRGDVSPAAASSSTFTSVPASPAFTFSSDLRLVLRS
ncbi:hypothetical protein BOTNAR_0303g00070 [Botryotinia narcissicola]|uniref:Uncharacterized protein n=1 Tax=Botryotinia narcissicola TaxID=278944 RepID=A0A4Z1HVV5_9HELO|nr:hypothetical protein BOTNAR_0303g00070 [Botryotinia narcissicola]